MLAAAVLLPAFPRAFTTTGFTLDASARHMRVFPNFGDPEANDNTTADPNWPGVTGAALALRKGAAEWSSVLHGDGSGDPTQPGGLGSGGANFDVEWDGLATGPGGATDNIVSEISGCSGGVLAFSECSGAGWRVRFYSCWTFDDGPGAPAAGTIDLQGIFAHEYGHCLGLGHTTAANATMAPAIDPLLARSIEADDQAGVQFLYGEAAATKPRIRAVAGATHLWIVGESFASTGNSVHFLGVDLAGVASTAGGTAIQFTLIAGTQAGDVQVKRAPGNGAFFSNGWPFDPGACAPPAPYCTSKVNSQGCAALIASVGTPSASQPAPFLITASGVLNQKLGLLFYGTAPAGTPFQGGTLCVGGTLRRTLMQSSGGNPPPNDCSGTFSFDFNARIQSGVDPALAPGNAVFAQYLYRDPPDAFGTGLTDALTFTVCP